jgi:hypothetical protein
MLGLGDQYFYSYFWLKVVVDFFQFYVKVCKKK